MEAKTEYRSADLPVDIVHMHPQESLRLHAHERLELVCILQGSGTHLLSGRHAWELAPGDVFSIPGGQRHGYRQCRDLHLINLMIEQRWLAGSGLRAVPGFTAFCNLEPLLRNQHDFNSHLRLDAPARNALRAQLTALMEACSLARPARGIAVRAQLELILVALAQAYVAAGSQAGTSLLRLESALRLIDGQLHRPLPLEQLAEAAHVSLSTLNRLFHDCFDRSPGDYLIDRRIEHAKRLLRDSDLNIRAIARQVGIPDANYFSRLFKQRLGRTPRAWRLAGK